MVILLLAVAFCFLNVALWVVMLTRFKKLFTADDIIAEYQKELHSMTVDVDQHASRTISIIENAEKELKALIAEAERRIVLAKNELAKQEQSKALLQRLNAKTAPAARQKQSAPSRAASVYAQAQADSSYALTGAGRRQAAVQGSLFDSDEPVKNETHMQEPNLFTVNHSGASYASVPVISPDVSFVENPIRPQKDFSEQVRELASFGHSVDEIARALERSTTEVQFVLDMGF